MSNFKLRKARTFGPTKITSAFTQFFQLCDEGCRSPGEQALVLPKFATIAVEHNNRGKPFDLILLGELLILSPGVDSLGLSPREIYFKEHQIVIGVVFELLFRENFTVENNTVAAPVGPGEIEQQQLIVRLGFLLCLFVISSPVGVGPCG